LLTGGRKKRSVGNNRQGGAPGELAAHDELVEDPVCHIYIPKRQAIVLHDSETPVYFCSEQCRKMYCDAHKTDRQENG
jgi:YHS domain-containing protein